MTFNQITKKREKLLEIVKKQRELGRELTDDMMSELEAMVKKNNGCISFKRPVNFESKGWSIVAYSVIWHDYHGWDEKKRCSEHHEQLCIDKRSNISACGILCESDNPDEDTLFPLRYWSESGTKTGLLYMVYEAAVKAINK